MCRLATVLIIAAALAVLVAATPAPSARAEGKPTAKAAPGESPGAEATPAVVIFNFTSPGKPARGPKLADALRLRAARLGKVTVVDAFSTADTLATGELPTLESNPETIARLLRDRFAAQIGLWGRVTRDAGGKVTIEAVGVDLRPEAARAIFRKTYSAKTPQEVNARYDELLADLTGIEKTVRPKEADPEFAARVKVRPRNLVTNGNFEAPGEQPKGWFPVNNLTMFLDASGDKTHGRVLRIDSDVYESEVNRWQKRLAAGAPLKEAPKKTPTQGPKYNTIAGTYGVHNYSDAIAVTPGKTYRLEIDTRCRSTDFFFPKLFFRGWADVRGEDRIVYDGYLSLRSLKNTDRWKHNVRLFTVPTPEELGGRRIKFVRLMIFAYWPPGDYEFDNVALREVLIDARGKPVVESKSVDGPSPKGDSQ